MTRKKEFGCSNQIASPSKSCDYLLQDLQTKESIQTLFPLGSVHETSYHWFEPINTLNIEGKLQIITMALQTYM